MASLIPMFDIFDIDNSFIQTDACILFNFVSGKYSGWGYGFSMFILTNIIWIIIMMMAYLQLVLHVYRSSQNLSKMGNTEAGKKRVISNVKAVLILSGSVCL